VGEQGRHVLAKAIGEKQWGAVGGQYLRHLVDKALSHGQGAIADVDRQQQFALGVHRHLDRMGRTLQTRDSLGPVDLAILDRTEQGKQFIELSLSDLHVVQEVL